MTLLSTFKEQLPHWLEKGAIRPLDKALVDFLAEHLPAGDAATAERPLLMALLTSQQLGAGHICLDINALVRDPGALLSSGEEGPASATDENTLLNHVKQQLQAETAAGLAAQLAGSPLVDNAPETDTGAPLVLDGQRLYLRRYWRQECQVAMELRQRARRALTSPADLAARLERLFGKVDTTANEPDWQRVACALATRQALTVITGGPGTGKTTTVVKLLGLLQSVAMENGAALRIRLAAPTGKAAARLSESIGRAVSALKLDDTVRDNLPTKPVTLHRLLGRRPGSRHFVHDRHNPLHADLVVLDEASMIDLEMMAGLLDALRPETRLVLLGDKDQLSSVEAGAVMADLCRDASAGQYDSATVEWLRQHAGADVSPWAGDGSQLAQATAMLRRNWRFKDAPGIGALAEAINAGDSAAAATAWAAGHDDLARESLAGIHDTRLEAFCVAGFRPLLALASAPPADITAQAPWAREVLSLLGDFQLLCSQRRGPAGVEGLNQRIASAVCQAGLTPREDGWYPGRPVMVTRNDYRLGLMNGDVGIALMLDDGDGPRLRVAFLLPDGSLKQVLPSRLSSVETAFAMTVHKSQGSEFRHAALVLPDTDHPLVTRELLYTAVTRARQRFTLLASGTGVEAQGIQRRTWRASGLAERLP